MSKWIAEFELEDGDRMPEHMDLEYHGVKLDFHCRPIGKTYEDGLNEAWELARDIVCLQEDGGKPVEWLENTFGSARPNIVLRNYSALEAIEQLEKYDARNKIVHVGDEIYSELTNSKAVVQRIDAWNRYECFTDNGAQLIIDKHTFNDYWVKTGKNYPQITEVLKQMKESE